MYIRARRHNAMWGHDGEKKKWQIESDRLTNASMKRDTAVGKKRRVGGQKWKKEKKICVGFCLSFTKKKKQGLLLHLCLWLHEMFRGGRCNIHIWAWIYLLIILLSHRCSQHFNPSPTHMSAKHSQRGGGGKKFNGAEEGLHETVVCVCVCVCVCKREYF